MYTSDIKKRGSLRYRKTILVYLAVAVLAAAVNKIYAVFGHGVSSASMTWMFLYPLLLGAAFYLLIGCLFPGLGSLPGIRLFCNIYNCAVALLSVGSLLKGIMFIAGTGSRYIKLYYEAGCIFIAAALIILVVLIAKSRDNK